MPMSQPLISLVTTLFLFIISSSPNSNADPTRDIFLLAGQSNMAGRGGVHHGTWDRFVPPECQSSPDILRLNSRDSWEVAHEPLHADIDVGKTCGVGPGMAFARGLRSLGGSRFGVIGLVPCALGGTKISQWARGTALYGQLVRRAEVAMQLEGGGKIRGVLWYQGESDTVTIEDATAYKGRMEKFIGDLRSDLGDPSLFIIQVALASGEGKYVEMVRAAQLGIALPNVKCVDARGLRLEADHLHLTTMSQARLGLLFARTFLDTSHGQTANVTSCVGT